MLHGPVAPRLVQGSAARPRSRQRVQIRLRSVDGTVGEHPIVGATPSIKGSVFAGVVEDVNKAVSDSSLSPDDLARWLEPTDLELLGSSILVSAWYDIRAYTRMNEFLRDVEGQGSNEYLRQLGRQTAARLLDAGFYAQLEFLQRTEIARATGRQARFEAFGRDLRKLTTISASILNFSTWKFKPDPVHEGRYVIEVTEAVDFPEVLCWRSDGFVNEMAARHGDSDLWGWQRVSADRIVFRMMRPL